jgi:phosphate transport system permease protein
MEDTAFRAPLPPPDRPAGPKIDLPSLEKSLRRPRSFINFVLNSIATMLTLAALVPLFSVIWMLFLRGGRRLSLAVFSSLPPAPLQTGGGFGNCIVGTLLMVGIAALLSVPFGILAAIYLAEVGPESRLAQVVRFGAKVLTGLPSVLAGVFAYGTIVLLTGGLSAMAGGAALSLLMLPTVILTAEEAIRMVPARVREAAIGMGATPTQTIWHVLLPTAMPGILTGIMLGVARAAGETAPLLIAAGFRAFWPRSIMQPTPSLAVYIYKCSTQSESYENIIELGWCAALVLVLMVLVTNLIGQSLSKNAVHE